MPIQSGNLATANGGLVSLDFTYDDVSNIIQTVSITNNGAFGTVIVTLLDRNTGAVIFGPLSRSFGTGVFSTNVAARNIQMVSVVGKGGTVGLATPFNTSVEWDNG